MKDGFEGATKQEIQREPKREREIQEIIGLMYAQLP